MAERFDVVVAGGGVIGSAVACFLALEPEFAGSVAVIEPDPTYATASTALSVGGIRRQFSTPENIAISEFSWQFLRSMDAHLRVDDEAPDVGLVESAYLFLASPAGAADLHRVHAVQREHGVAVALLTPADLAARFPWLVVDDLGGGSLGLGGEGWLDPWRLLQAFRRKARALGVAYRTDRVVGLKRSGRTIGAALLASGDRLDCGWLVNATGPRAAAIAAMAGIDLPVRPRKRLVFSVRAQDPPPPTPLVIDPSGVYFRPDGEGLLCGRSPPPDRDPDCLDLEVDHAWFETAIWPVLAARVPAFAAVKVTGAWAGHYAVNTIDGNAILGPHPDVDNLLFANGFSGHGLQQAPAVGRALADWIAFGRYRALDLTGLGWGRLADGRGRPETAIV